MFKPQVYLITKAIALKHLESMTDEQREAIMKKALEKARDFAKQRLRMIAESN